MIKLVFSVAFKAHRPKYRDRLSIDIEQVQSEIDEHEGAVSRTPWLAQSCKQNDVKRMT
ncbi:MAG TPA: hypothetical protein VFM05_03390 [Candidatus Saccharimonadales bacterium]|nr:hypothetical protein [Candidatus Saccharimonadales bacterium]